MDEEVAVIVVDCGSCWSKAGFNVDELPRSIFPTVIGRPKNRGLSCFTERVPPSCTRDKLLQQHKLHTEGRVYRGFGGMACRGMIDAYVGEEAQFKRDLLDIDYPMVHGVVNNWGNMEKVSCSFM